VTRPFESVMNKTAKPVKRGFKIFCHPIYNRYPCRLIGSIRARFHGLPIEPVPKVSQRPFQAFCDQRGLMPHL